MLHSLLANFRAEFEAIKSPLRHDNFNQLKFLLLNRSRAIESQNQEGLQASYIELFKEIKKLKVIAEKNVKSYMKHRAALIKKMDTERKIVSGEPLLATYVEGLDELKRDILNFNPEIDVNYLKKLEETLQQEKTGFSQQSLFSFFHVDIQQQDAQSANHQMAGVRQ